MFLKALQFGSLLINIETRQLQQTLVDMENTKRSRAVYWLAFLLTTALMIFMLMYMPAWFWVPLPFVLTSFVLALDWM